ncbi:MAG: hypothetical protein JXA69_18390 [Phycisphaerae bacterium]|nr:hypothetical protein [Phycisphaerae bacterium]
MRARYVLVVVVIVAGLSADGFAQESPASQPAGLDLPACEREAAARAFASLSARLFQLPMTDRLTVGEWVGDRTPVDLALRRAAYDHRAITLLAPQNDESCRVEIAVPVAAMARAWAQRLRDDSLVPDGELEAIREWSMRAGAGRLSATGTARQRYAPDAGSALPVGWEHLTPDAVELARVAARVDAAQGILTECRQLRFSAAETLGDVFDMAAAFETAFERQILRRLDGQPFYEPYGVCRFPVRLARADLLALLSLAAAEVPESIPVPRMDLTRLTDPAWRDAISVEGVGVSPPVSSTEVGSAGALGVPAWASDLLTAIGHGNASEEASGPDPAGRRKVSVAMARIDAIRNMWAQVDELLLPDGRRARNIILANPALADPLTALEGRMREVGQPIVRGDEVTVKITMPLGPLWDVLASTVRAEPASSAVGGPTTNCATAASSVEPATQPADGP